MSSDTATDRQQLLDEALGQLWYDVIDLREPAALDLESYV